jgi:molybdopterin synthase sulfur carrier subunit
MQVRVFGTLRHFAGAKSVEVEVEPGDTVESLLRKLTTEHPILEEKVFDGKGNLQNSIHFLVNGRSIRYLDGLDSPIRETDQVALFPAVGGG